jgi:hypothetical protein
MAGLRILAGLFAEAIQARFIEAILGLLLVGFAVDFYTGPGSGKLLR